MKTSAFALAVACAVALPMALAAQEAQKPAPAPITASAGLKNLYTNSRTWILKAAETMPEEHYAFKPTPDVRSFGELLGHVANSQYQFCAPVKKVANPNKDNVEKTATTKTAVVAALKEAFAFCDALYDLPDSGLTEMVKMGQREGAVGYGLTFNVAHNFEHYGNIVTYMRLKGLVPPSSQR